MQNVVISMCEKFHDDRSRNELKRPILMPNTHRRPRRDETVELRHVGGVNTIRN